VDAVGLDLIYDAISPEFEKEVIAPDPNIPDSESWVDARWRIASEPPGKLSVVARLQLNTATPGVFEEKLLPLKDSRTEDAIKLSDGRVEITILRQSQSGGLELKLELRGTDTEFPMGIDGVDPTIQIDVTDEWGMSKGGLYELAKLESPRVKLNRPDAKRRPGWSSALGELENDFRHPNCTPVIAQLTMNWIEAGKEELEASLLAHNGPEDLYTAVAMTKSNCERIAALANKSSYSPDVEGRRKQLGSELGEQLELLKEAKDVSCANGIENRYASELRATAGRIASAIGTRERMAKYLEAAANLEDQVLAGFKPVPGLSWEVRGVGDVAADGKELPILLRLRGEVPVDFALADPGREFATYVATRALTANELSRIDESAAVNVDAPLRFADAQIFSERHGLELPTRADLAAASRAPAAGPTSVHETGAMFTWCADALDAGAIWSETREVHGAIEGWHLVVPAGSAESVEQRGSNDRIAPDESARPEIELRGVGLRPVLRVKLAR
jgi:hypothetical protein